MRQCTSSGRERIRVYLGHLEHLARGGDDIIEGVDGGPWVNGGGECSGGSGEGVDVRNFVWMSQTKKIAPSGTSLTTESELVMVGRRA